MTQKQTATQTQQKPINRLNDLLFKAVFGSDSNKLATMSLINAILGLEGDHALRDITFTNTEKVPEEVDDKLCRFDITGELSNGDQIDIEIQVTNEGSFEKRTLFYWTRMYSLAEGQDYSQLRRSIAVNIMDFNVWQGEVPHSVFALYNLATGERMTDDIEIHFIEMKKYRPTPDAPMTKLDKWLAYLGNKLDETEFKQLLQENPDIAAAHRAEVKFMKLTANQLAYQRREDAIRDFNSAMRSSEEKGRRTEQKRIIKTMRLKGMSAAEITEMVDLTLQQVEQYIAEINAENLQGCMVSEEATPYGKP